MHTYSSNRKLYSAYSVEDTRLDIQATQMHIELQHVAYEKQDNFTQIGISPCRY